jgi:allantoate deiminase
VGFVTCEEEDSRFHAGFMGARSLLGRVEAPELDEATDGAGTTWRAALEAARARGCAAPLARGGRPFRPPFRPAIMLELHIEQGPVLEAEGLSLGIVDRIAGYRRLNAHVEGEARHAGTTPMARRRDALAAAAEMALAAEACAAAKGAPAVATAGNLSAQPGLANVVPGVCDLTLEVRHVEAAALEALDADLRARCAGIAQRRGVRLTITERPRQEPTELSAPLAAEAEALARSQGIAFKRMASGAAHDAMIFARAGVPALMVFVPSEGGVSHSPEERTGTQALALGLRFGAMLAAGLAVAPPVVAGGAA